MEKRKFGRTGYEVSVLGFGAAPVGFLETEQQKVALILNTLLDEGVNLIDTAAAYAGSEEAIGRAVALRRSEFILVSKCGAPGDPASDEWNPDSIRSAVDRSLSRLKTDFLDVMLLHSGGLEILRRGDALGELVLARDAGKIRHLGYAGDNEAAAHAVTIADIDVLELSINLCDQSNIDAVLPAARERNLAVIAKRPIANAAWKKPSEQPGFYQDYTQTYTGRLSRMQISPSDLGFEGDQAELWPEIALRFTLSQPGVHTAIIGTTDPGHARANLRAAAKGPLPADATGKLQAAFRAAEAASGEPWRGET